MDIKDLMNFCKENIIIESNISNNGDLDFIIKCKSGNKIHIKKKNRGLFKKYCKGKVTNECILRGKNSPDPKIRRRATFAQNARRWSKK